ncbi:unnamed protein product [Rhizophagus irregularis]|nr:unnamed protein product [Rhizophagus irregularis]
MYNWNDADRTSAPKQQSSTLNMIMHISPETSFSHDGPANVLSSRHIPFSTSAVLQPKYAPHHSQPIDFNKELDSITSTQQIIHSQLDFILTKLDAGQDPFSADGSDRIDFFNNSSFSFHVVPSTHSTSLSSSNILRLGSLNVRSLVSPTKQLNLFSILLSHALHGIILTETNLCSPTHRYICNPYLSSYKFQSWFTHSPTTNRHSGVGIILHSSLAIYVIKKKFFSDRLISLTMQLPGKRNILLIGVVFVSGYSKSGCINGYPVRSGYPDKGFFELTLSGYNFSLNGSSGYIRLC